MKYPDQDKQFRRGAWSGDGVEPIRRPRAPKAVRLRKRADRDRELWSKSLGSYQAFLHLKHGN